MIISKAKMILTNGKSLGDFVALQHSVETNSECEEENSDGQQTPEQAAYSKEKPAAVTTAVTINNNNVTESREKGDAVNLNTSFVQGMQPCPFYIDNPVLFTLTTLSFFRVVPAIVVFCAGHY